MVNPEYLGVGYPAVTKKAVQNILQVLKSRRLSYGPFTKSFEQRFSRAHGCGFGLMVNSGTSALQIAVAALAEAHGWQPGDEVIVPALTFVATSNVVIQQGFKPVFVDVDPHTYNINPSHIAAAITSRTRAIMAVHLFGQPAEMDPILAIAREHNLKIIEDSCETMFARYRGRAVGSLGDIGCFSTYACHILVTGVGGLALTNNQEYAVLLRSLANHGRDGIYTSMDDNQKSGEALREVVEKRFRFVRNGYSYRATEFEGAFGCAQLDIAPAMIRQRRMNAARLTRGLQGTARTLQLPWHPPHVSHSFMMYPIVIQKDAPFTKAELVMHLENHGIETRDMLPLTNQPYYRDVLGVREADYPVAQWINQNGFYVGCHQNMGPEEMNLIAHAIQSFIRTRTSSV